MLLAFWGGEAFARSITARQAEQAVSGWLGTGAQSAQSVRGLRVKGIEVFTDEMGEPAYYCAALAPSGFVLVSSDDEIEPIIGFSYEGHYDPSESNPLGALVSSDIRGRIAAVRSERGQRDFRHRRLRARAKGRWDRFIGAGPARTEGYILADLTTPEGSLESSGMLDVRVGPLLQSTWAQHNVCDIPCYNYYTPDNYRAGCVAVTMAQIMRYHQHPAGAIGVEGFWIRKDNSDWYGAFTLGGDGAGGPYLWDYMAFTPTCATTAFERSAIGALCYDAAISINTVFGYTSSQADTLKAKESLVETFKYAYSVKGYNGGDNIGDALLGMINPNLDAGDPVILGIRGTSGHAVVCDGYGYSDWTLYHHLNMGWGGVYDAWYNLPNIDCNPSYSSIYKCVYNIRPTGSFGGEVISGRLYYPTGSPIANKTVYAQALDYSELYSTTSDDKGIYAFDDLAPESRYSIYSSAPEGYRFDNPEVRTGRSRDNSAVSGNIWGVNLPARPEFEALVGHWKLDEASGERAADSAGINDGTVYGGASWAASGGAFDGALSFDGNDYVEIPDEGNFDLEDEITVAAWVNISVVDKDWQSVITKGDSAWRLSTLRSESKFHFAVTGPPNHVAVDGSVSIGPNEWHHVCGIYDGSNVRLYIDGMQDPSSPVAYSGGITTNDYPVYIGENAENTGRRWKGLIDDVRIYNYALSAGEAAKLMCRAPAAGDINSDCQVDMTDYAVFTSAWLSSPGDAKWNSECDISSPADGVVDMRDLNIFLNDWPRGSQ
ncbi:MAG: C10 family peptidase [Sedimentisphaerales bacterium]|nr:C10 family peptidase [Sedimentisphaerales bacterium]